MKLARYFAGWLLRWVGWWLIEAGYRIDGNKVDDKGAWPEGWAERDDKGC